MFHSLKRNQFFLLTEPGQVWILRTGSIALFAAHGQAGFSTPDRRYLFDLMANQALFSTATDDSTAVIFLVVALEETELIQTSVANLAGQMAAGDTTAIAYFQSWVNRLGQSCRLNNRNGASLFSSSPAQMGAVELEEQLAQFHIECMQALDECHQREVETAFHQFQHREYLSRQVIPAALSKLADALQPQQGIAAPGETSLLVAAGAVGRAIGISIRPPQVEHLDQRTDPVEEIARASQFRIRRITLEPHWWRQQFGAFLGFTDSQNNPVALLPVRNRYLVFDPTTTTSTPVNRTVAATLTQEAYQFYRPLPLLINQVLQIFQFGLKGYETDLLRVVALGTIATLLSMIVPFATGLLIDQAIPNSDRQFVWQLGLALVALAIGRSLLSLSQGILALRIENAAASALQPAIWDRLLRLSLTFFRQYASGDLVIRVLSVNQIRQKLSGGTLRALLSGLFALLNLGLMIVYSWRLAVVGVGIALATGLVTAVSGWLLVRQLRQQQDLEGEINGLTVQLINGVAKLRVAVAEARAFAAWAEPYSQRTQLVAGVERIQDGVLVVNEVVSLVTVTLLFAVAVPLLQTTPSQEGLSIGTFLAFNSALGIFIGGVSSLSTLLTDLWTIGPLWQRAKPILQAEPESGETKAHPGTLQGRVAIDRVTFRYQAEGAPVLNEVSLHAQPGEFVAIIGASGSGKSTIIRLLLGFEMPEAGTVSYDSRNLVDLDLGAVRRQLGVVLQNGRIGGGSIFDLVTAGALVSQDQAWEAVRLAGLAPDLEQMPMGLHTVISEGGSTLSGGQRQRLLIARALVNRPKLLLMDEATSALDHQTQSRVMQSLEQLQVTRIIIAHRLSTIRNADRIYVLEAGRVVQVGTYEELVQQQGLFAQLACEGVGER